jgi:ATP-binding protein involved in chromosome partitioning
MKLAIPLAGGSLAMHFGHCEQFAIIETDEAGNILSREDIVPPAHAPGVLPEWLGELNVTHIIAGGMGSRAQNLFSQKGITTIVGAHEGNPEELVKACVEGTLKTGENICDH